MLDVDLRLHRGQCGAQQGCHALHTHHQAHRPTNHLGGSRSSAPAPSPGPTTTGPNLGTVDAWGPGFLRGLKIKAWLPLLASASSDTSSCLPSQAAGLLACHVAAARCLPTGGHSGWATSLFTTDSESKPMISHFTLKKKKTKSKFTEWLPIFRVYMVTMFTLP